MSADLRVVTFGDKRDGRQTLLQAGTDETVMDAVVIKVHRPTRGDTRSAVSVSWSSGVSKLEVLGLLSVAEQQVQEWGR